MNLPFGESPENIKDGRAGARALLVFFGFALAVGIFALPHGAAAATETLDEIANLRASNITGNGTATSIHLQVDPNDIAGSTLNVTESDYNSRNGVYRSLTTNTATAFNAFLYRAQEPNNNRTSMFTVQWVGRSSTTANPVVLQVYKFAGSATGWRTIASVVPPASSTVFSVSGTVFTASSTNYQMDNFYSSDPSGDISGASVIAVRIYQQNASGTIPMKLNLQTDMVTSTFGTIGLTQSSYIFLNDNGDDPSLNSARGGVAPDTAITSVNRGERLNLRVQLTATTTAGLAQIPLVRKNFRLQYTALPGGASDCSTVSDTNWQFIGDGAQPTSITSISPTSINVSRSLSGYQGKRLTTLKAAALPGGVTKRSGLFIESTDQTSATSVIATSVDYFALGPDQGTELSYAIHTGDAQPGATFCFRLVADDLGPALNIANPASPTTIKFTAYESYPKLTIASGSANNLRYSKGVALNTTDRFTDLTTKVSSFVNDVFSPMYDSFNHLVFFGTVFGTNSFGKYDPATDTFTDLSSNITWASASVRYLAYDSFDHLMFFGSGSGTNQFGKYDPVSDKFTDLSAIITWPSTFVVYLTYDSFDHLIFFGAGANNQFGKYDPASGTFTDLSSKITWTSANVQYLIYDSFDHLIFFGSGNGSTNQFATYDPAADIFTDLSARITWSGTRVDNLAYDSWNHLIFFGSGTTANKVGKYDPASATFTELSNNFNFGSTVADLVYDSYDHLIMFTGGSSNRKVGKYDPTTNTFTNLSGFVPGSWTNAGVNGSVYDSFNHLVFFGSSTGGVHFGRYDPGPSARKWSIGNIAEFVNDAALFLDASSYSALATASDNQWDSVTSVTSTSFTTSSPMFLFKVKDTNSNPSLDSLTFTASGMTSRANTQTASTVMEIFNLSTSSWEVLTGDASAGVFTPTTWSASKTSGQAPSYFDSASTVYVRVRRNTQTGADNAPPTGLHLDYFNVQFGAAGPPPSDSLITQRAFIFESDNGTTVDTNTQRGTGIAYPVEQGERFIVRFQVDNTGAGATTAQFTVQYDHNDGVWKSVTAGEISAQLGISGANGDALTTNKAGSCQAGTSFVNGAYQEGTATTNSFTLTNGNCTEFGFIFSTATAVPRTTYNFRLVNGTNGNQVLQNSVATPSIVIITMREKTYSKTGLGAELAAAPPNANDLTYYLDSTGYAAIIKKDGSYDTASSSGAGNIPISLFKIRNYNENTTDSFTITWIGHSNVAPSSNNIFLDLWDNTHSTWITASTDNFTTAGTDFTFSSATSGSLFYDANYFVYVRVRQAAGVEALSTDQVSIGFGNNFAGPQVDRADILSDPRPSATSNHTISFIVTSGFDASERLELTWPLDFAFPPDLDCGDVDVATGTQFMLSTTSTACAATATNWGVEFMSDTRVFRLTAPSTAGTYVATGTQVTITIGLNASFQQSGTTAIVNPAAVGTYPLDVGGPVGTGRMLVSINVGVTVSAIVAENLSLTVSSVAALNCTADDGASVTAIGTSPTSVPFGTVSLNAFYIGCQDLVVSTNGPGYSLTTQESSAMMTAGGVSIPDTTCDAGTCSESAAAAWATATHNGFGHTCFNQDNNHDCDASYSSGTNFRQVANMSAGETAQSVMSSSTAASATGRIKFRLSAGSAQGAGVYTTAITYIITATY